MIRSILTTAALGIPLSASAALAQDVDPHAVPAASNAEFVATGKSSYVRCQVV